METPAITAAALFTAIIINDAARKNSTSIPNHAFFGLIVVLAISYLSMNGANMVAWGILVLPMFIIILSFLLSYSGSSTNSNNVPIPNVVPGSAPISPGGAPISSCGAPVPPTPPTSTATSVQLPIGKTIQLNPIGTNVSMVTPNSASCASHI